MRGIDSVQPDTPFLECVTALRDATGIDRVMFSGGEPTIHPAILDLVACVSAPLMSLTSNGITLHDEDWWRRARTAGLSKVIFSVHDATVQSFQALESTPRAAGWALRGLNAQQANIINADKAGISVRANVVVYDGADNALRVIKMLRALPVALEIRLLNDLSNVVQTKREIDAVCAVLEATHVGTERRAGTSNVSTQMRGSDGFMFSVKLSYPYFFDAVCGSCTMKSECLEGFYGLRLERRGGEYTVRLCIYKQTADLLMPWREFLQTDLAARMRDLYRSELEKT